MADQAAQEYDKLNPGVAPVQENSFLNYSKLDNLQSSAGDLMKNLGSTVEAGVKGVDTWLKETIRTEATASVDNIRDEQTRKLMGAQAPGDIGLQAKGLGNLKTAMEQGVVKPEYYYMQLDSAARQLRSRYPGYREHIDNVMHDLTGVTPANQVVKDLFHTAASKRDPEDQLNAHLVKEYTDVGGGAYIAQVRQQTGANPTNNDLLQRVGGVKGAAYSLAQAKAALTYKVEQGTSNEADIERTARVDLQQAHASEMREGGGMFSDLQTLRKQTDEMRKMGEKNVLPSSEQVAQLAQSANNIDIKLKATTQRILNDPMYNNPNDPSKSLSPKARKDLMDMTANMSELIRTGLTKDGKLSAGHLDLAGELFKYQSESDAYSLLQPSPVLRTVAAANKTIGAQGVATMLDWAGQLSKPGDPITKQSVVNALNAKNHILDMATGETTLPQIQDKANADPTNMNGVASKAIGASKEVILDKNKSIVDPKRLEPLVNGMYGTADKFIAKIPSAERHRAYQDLTSPEMSTRMFELKKQGQEGMWNTYTSAIDKMGLALTRQTILDTRERLGDKTSAFQIEYDVKTSRFVPSMKEGTPEFMAKYQGLWTKTARDLNTSIAPLVATQKLSGASSEQIAEKLGSPKGWFAESGIDFKSLIKEEPKAGEAKPAKESNSEPIAPRSLASAQIAPSPSTLTPEDKAAVAAPTAQENPMRGESVHIEKNGGKYYIIPNVNDEGKELSKSEIAAYIANRKHPAYGIGFDDLKIASERMAIVEKLNKVRKEKGNYDFFGIR